MFETESSFRKRKMKTNVFSFLSQINNDSLCLLMDMMMIIVYKVTKREYFIKDHLSFVHKMDRDG